MCEAVSTCCSVHQICSVRVNRLYHTLEVKEIEVNVIFGNMSKLKILQPAEENQEFLDIDETASNDGDDEQKHEKLLNAIAKLGKNKK